METCSKQLLLEGALFPVELTRVSLAVVMMLPFRIVSLLRKASIASVSLKTYTSNLVKVY